MGPIETLEDLFGMLRRRRLMIGLIMGVGIAVSVLLAQMMPKVFEAAAVIQVETPVIAGRTNPDGTVQADGSRSAQILQLIEQRLMTRESLMAVIERQKLYAEAVEMPADQKIEQLRNSVRFLSVATPGQQTFGAPASVSALIINTSFLKAEEAARVANDFAQAVLDQGSQGQAERSREAMGFFLEEDARVGQEIVALEAEIAEFKNLHSDTLPGANDSRRTELVTMDTDLRAIDQRLVGLIGERSALEKSENLRAVERRQIDTLNADITVLEAQKAALQARRDEVSGALSRTPEIERELNAMTRRLQQLQDQYSVITRRLAEAQTSQRLEERNQSERFTLLERAVTPENPTGGGGNKVMAVGIMASLALALGLPFMLEVMNPVLRTRGQMERRLDLRPVITIPEVTVGRGTSPQGHPLLRFVEALPRPVVLALAVLVFLAVMAVGAISG